MSRREYSKTQGGNEYLEWLRSLGCILYAPLRTDLQELMNDCEFVPTGDGEYYFDEEGLVVTTPNTAHKTVLNISPPNWSSKLTQDWTIMAEGYAVTNSSAGNTTRPTLFSNIGTNSEGAPQYYGSPFRSAIPKLSTFVKAARVNSLSLNTMYYYIDGALDSTSIGTYDMTTAPLPYNQGFTLGCAGHANFRNCKFKFREFMFFNRALTETEIRQIQGYE